MYNDEVIPDNYAQATLSYTGTGVPTGAANTFGISLTDALLSPTDVATIVRAAWATIIMPNLTDDVTLTDCLVKFGPDDTGPSAVISGTTAGGVVATSAVPSVSYLCLKNTDAGGRRGKGRFFLPGVAESLVDDSGIISSGQVTALQVDMTSLLASLTSQDVGMVLLRNPTTEWVLVDGQPRRVPTDAPVPSPAVVQSIAVSNKAATQRRRLRR